MTLNAFGGTGPPGGIDLNFVKQDREAANVLTPMGITSENVAAHFAVGRSEQDAFAAESHSRAHRAQEQGLFDEEILPVRVSKCTVGVSLWWDTPKCAGSGHNAVKFSCDAFDSLHTMVHDTQFSLKVMIHSCFFLVLVNPERIFTRLEIYCYS